MGEKYLQLDFYYPNNVVPTYLDTKNICSKYINIRRNLPFASLDIYLRSIYSEIFNSNTLLMVVIL